METISCNLCGSNEYVTVYQISDWLLDRPSVKSTFVKCRTCGLLYQNPRPCIDEMSQHYPPEYEPHQNYNKHGDSYLIKKAISYGLDIRARAITKYKQPGTLLDVGCAAGDFLNHMRQKYGWQVQGVEVSDLASQAARDHYSLDVFTGPLEQANFPPKSFDAVTMWDVLEHLHNPKEALKEVHRILKPDGLFVFRVPNGGSLDAKFFGPYWSGFDSPRHLYVFQKRTIMMLLEKAGFQLLKATSKHGSYLSFVLSIRLWMVARGVRKVLQDTIMNALYHPVTRIVAAPFFYLYGLPQKTSQIMIIAIKK